MLAHSEKNSENPNTTLPRQPKEGQAHIKNIEWSFNHANFHSHTGEYLIFSNKHFKSKRQRRTSATIHIAHVHRLVKENI